MALTDAAARIEPATLARLDTFTPLDFTSVHTMRAGYEPTPTPPAPARPEVTREDATIEGVRVRWYRPAGESSGAAATLLWLHGGGYVMGNLNENDDRLDRLVIATGCSVVAVDWRLAPEHPYPAGLDDATAVYRALLASGLEPARIVVGGASAGSGVAAALCLRLRELGLPQPALQLLIYPMLDDREITESIRATVAPMHKMIWPLHAYRLCWESYLGDLAGTDVPATAAPARAEDLSGLARAALFIGDVDPFLDENLEYGRRLARDGVPTELHVYPGVIHGGYGAVPDTPQTQALLDDVHAALRAVC